jgi:hypothetical protein
LFYLVAKENEMLNDHTTTDGEVLLLRRERIDLIRHVDGEMLILMGLL